MQISSIKIYGVIVLLSVFGIQSCADKIVTDCEITVASIDVEANLTSIQKNVFDKNCAIAGCHSGPTPTGNLLLTAGKSYEALINVDNLQGTAKRVIPGDSQNSYLMFKLNSDNFEVMPPSGQLSKAIRDSIASWIDMGALNN
jgi:hypothetical protein